MAEANQAVGVINAFGVIIDEIWTSDEEREIARRLLTELEQKPHLLQAEINKTEAAHPSVFVSGWRPFVGWVCGLGIGYHYIFRDLLAWGFAAAGIDQGPLPEIQLGELMGLLVAMLGLGGVRTFEAMRGVRRDNLK